MEIKNNIFNIKIIPLAFSILALLLSVILIISFKDGKTVKTQQRINTTQIILGNVTDSSFTVFFKTDQECAALVEYGVLGSFERRAYSTKGGKIFNHFVKISGLSPSTEYNFRIVDENNLKISEEKTIKTGSTLPFPPTQPFFGQLVDKAGNPISNAILIINIYGNASKTAPVIITSTQVNGSFTFNTGSLRNNDFSAYAFDKLEKIDRVDIHGKVENANEFSLSLNAPFEKFALGAVNLGELRIDSSNTFSKSEAGIPKLFNEAGVVLAANSISFDFLVPGRWDIAIYTPVSAPLGASEFLSKLNSRCAVDAYWLDRLENGAWQSFILRGGIEYGESYPILYTGAYFVVVSKAFSNCSIDI